MKLYSYLFIIIIYLIIIFFHEALGLSCIFKGVETVHNGVLGLSYLLLSHVCECVLKYLQLHFLMSPHTLTFYGSFT